MTDAERKAMTDAERIEEIKKRLQEYASGDFTTHHFAAFYPIDVTWLLQKLDALRAQIFTIRVQQVQSARRRYDDERDYLPEYDADDDRR